MVSMRFAKKVHVRQACGSRGWKRFGALALAFVVVFLVVIGLPLPRDRRIGARLWDAGVEADAAVPTPSIHVALGMPVDADPSDDFVMVRPQYVLSYNPRRNAANWAAWNLNATHLGAVHRHRGKFFSDRSLPAGWLGVRHEDYSGSGYERGHLVSSEDRTQTTEDNEATFLLSNVLPQRHDVNHGPWLRFETYCHALAKKEGKELFLVAGGVYSRQPATIGSGVSVPEAFYKIAVVLERGQVARDVGLTTRVIAVLVPNVEGIGDHPWGMYRTTVRAIEQRTGYDFDRRVPMPIQAVLETRVDEGPTHAP